MSVLYGQKELGFGKAPKRTRFVMSRQSSLSIGASHVTTPSMVAMFGWIIPLPFPMPPIVMTLLSGKVISSAICFRAKSVVQMAVAAAEAAAVEFSSPRTRCGTAAISSVILIRFPITPVLSTSTSLISSSPSAAATVSALKTVSSIPPVPVAALAWPALMITARAVVLDATAFFENSTGAAATTFCVKQAALTAGPSATISAQSARLPDALIVKKKVSVSRMCMSKQSW